MLSRRARSALDAMTDLARLSRGQPVAARALASAGGLPPRQFETVLQDLVRAGLLRSVRGMRGGYELARERRRISLGDIIRAVEPVPASAGSPVDVALGQAMHAYLAALDAVSLDSVGEGPRDAATADFTI